MVHFKWLCAPKVVQRWFPGPGDTWSRATDPFSVLRRNFNVGFNVNINVNVWWLEGIVPGGSWVKGLRILVGRQKSIAVSEHGILCQHRVHVGFHVASQYPELVLVALACKDGGGILEMVEVVVERQIVHPGLKTERIPVWMQGFQR